MLEIRNLHAGIDGNEILKGINLTVKKGDSRHHGTKRFRQIDARESPLGHPQYEVTAGEIIYEGRNLLEMAPDERAREGVFMAFQYPIEVPAFRTRSFCAWLTTRRRNIRRRRARSTSSSKIS